MRPRLLPPLSLLPLLAAVLFQDSVAQFRPHSGTCYPVRVPFRRRPVRLMFEQQLDIPGRCRALACMLSDRTKRYRVVELVCLLPTASYRCRPNYALRFPDCCHRPICPEDERSGASHSYTARPHTSQRRTGTRGEAIPPASPPAGAGPSGFDRNKTTRFNSSPSYNATEPEVGAGTGHITSANAANTSEFQSRGTSKSSTKTSSSSHSKSNGHSPTKPDDKNFTDDAVNVSNNSSRHSNATESAVVNVTLSTSKASANSTTSASHSSANGTEDPKMTSQTHKSVNVTATETESSQARNTTDLTITVGGTTPVAPSASSTASGAPSVSKSRNRDTGPSSGGPESAKEKSSASQPPSSTVAPPTVTVPRPPTTTSASPVEVLPSPPLQRSAKPTENPAQHATTAGVVGGTQTAGEPGRQRGLGAEGAGGTGTAGGAKTGEKPSGNGGMGGTGAKEGTAAKRERAGGRQTGVTGRSNASGGTRATKTQGSTPRPEAAGAPGVSAGAGAAPGGSGSAVPPSAASTAPASTAGDGAPCRLCSAQPSPQADAKIEVIGESPSPRGQPPARARRAASGSWLFSVLPVLGPSAAGAAERSKVHTFDVQLSPARPANQKAPRRHLRTWDVEVGLPSGSSATTPPSRGLENGRPLLDQSDVRAPRFRNNKTRVFTVHVRPPSSMGP